MNKRTLEEKLNCLTPFTYEIDGTLYKLGQWTVKKSNKVEKYKRYKCLAKDFLDDNINLHEREELGEIFGGLLGSPDRAKDGLNAVSEFVAKLDTEQRQQLEKDVDMMQKVYHKLQKII